MPRYKDRTEAAMRRAYIGQRCRAKSRGIAFLFTFEQWRAWWLIDDRWGRRGRRADQLMMARCRALQSRQRVLHHAEGKQSRSSRLASNSALTQTARDFTAMAEGGLSWGEPLSGNSAALRTA